MSRKLQRFFDQSSSQSFVQVFGFFAIYYLLRSFTTLLAVNLLTYWGYSEVAAHQILDANEIFLQTGTLLASLWIVFRNPKLNTKRFLVQELLGEDSKRWPAFRVWLAAAIRPLMLGFMWASFGVALSILLGFLRIEGGSWGSYWFYLFPILLLRAAGVFCWILVLELVRLKMSRLMLPRKRENLMGIFALVLFEASLLHVVFKSEATSFQAGFMVLVAAWWSSLLVFWTLKSRNSILASWRRVCWISSFVIALTCLYGIPLSWGRLPSLATLYAAQPKWMEWGVALPSLLSQWVFILMFTSLAMFSFWRQAQKEKSIEDTP